MTAETSRYADFETLREQAVALRREGLSRRQIRDHLHVHNNDILNRLLEGEPPPEWTKRPNAKDDLRARARELRLEGRTYDQIQVELGCSKSSISLWVRDLPKPERKRTREEASEIARRGWEPIMRRREEARQAIKRAAAEEVGAVSARTNRKNVSDGYHGCLLIQILESADLYRRIEGAWCGIVGAVRTPRPGNRT